MGRVLLTESFDQDFPFPSVLGFAQGCCYRAEGMDTIDLSAQTPRGIDGIVEVICVRGARAASGALPDLLIEVPHGADRRADFDRLRARLHGDLPMGLQAFFHVNTDVGAWDYGLATAQALITRAPTRSVMLMRCLLPRTFVDCNRSAEHRGGNLAEGGLSAGIPDYVSNAGDRAHLVALHARYTSAVGAVFAAVCGAGGIAMTPHSYAPRSVGIATVGNDIVEQLKWAYQPERVASWPLRPEVDLLTRDASGLYLAPPTMEEQLVDAFKSKGYAAQANQTYHLAAGSLAAYWANRYPGQVLCLEVRRDLLVNEWRPFEAMTINRGAVDAIAGAIAPALEWALDNRAPLDR